MELTEVQGVGWIQELRGHHQSAPLCLSLPGQGSAVLTALLGHILLQQKTNIQCL